MEPLQLLVRKEIYIPLTSTFMFAACLFSLVFFMPIFLQVGLGESAAKAGLLIMPLSAGMICGAYITGKIISKSGVPKWMPVMGMSLSSLSFFALATLS